MQWLPWMNGPLLKDYLPIIFLSAVRRTEFLYVWQVHSFLNEHLHRQRVWQLFVWLDIPSVSFTVCMPCCETDFWHISMPMLSYLAAHIVWLLLGFEESAEGRKSIKKLVNIQAGILLKIVVHLDKQIFSNLCPSSDQLERHKRKSAD